MGETTNNPDYLNPDALANLCCQKTGGKKTCNSKGGFQVKCPAHPDYDASLSINRGDKGGTAIYCHAGCTAQEIMLSLGLNVSQLCATLFAKGGASGLKPNNQVSAFTYSLKDSTNSNNSSNSNNSNNSVPNPLLRDMPQSTEPRSNDPDEVKRALLTLTRYLALDKGMRDGETIPEEAYSIIDAWRKAYVPSASVMTVREEVSSMWYSVKTPLAEGILRTAFRMAREKTPKTCPERYSGTEYQLLFGVCWYMAEGEPDGIFFIPVRDGAEITGTISKSTIDRMLKAMKSENVLIHRPEFRPIPKTRNAIRYQLNPKYSSDPERKNRITVASWHRYTKSQIINMQTSSLQLTPVKEIQAHHGLDFDTEDFCRRGGAASWKTDYGMDLDYRKPEDLESAVISFAENLPKKAKSATQAE